MHPNSASARIRGEVVARYLAKVAPDWNVVFGDVTAAAVSDIVLFQKYYEAPEARHLARALTPPQKAVLDLCDADWTIPQKLEPLMEMLSYCSAAVGSHPLITTWLSDYCPAFTVGDGVDLEGLPPLKNHHDGHVLRVVWFGNKSNWGLIESKFTMAKCAGVELVTISDHPQATIMWNLKSVHADLQSCDLFWDPRGFGLEKEVKTNNKEQLAWALGLPVFHEEDLFVGLSRFGSAEARNKEAQYRRNFVETFFGMDRVIKQWKTVLVFVHQLC